MAATLSPPPPSSSDRLGVTLFVAAALHAILILGVTFGLPELEREPPPITLDVVLVHSKSAEAPERADALAQVEQSGGGELEEEVRPSSPLPVPRPVPQYGDTAQPHPPAAPPVEKRQRSQPVVATERPSRVETPVREERPEPPPELPSAAELMARAEAFARSRATAIDRRAESNSRRNDAAQAGMSTRSFDMAMYESAWQDKVERIGNLNYPDDAKRLGISGSLTLVVRIAADGSLLDVGVTRSSGHKVLDDGAARIVRMAAPFAPLPGERKEWAITRTWKFYSEGAVTAR